jgi:hypothetical protein
MKLQSLETKTETSPIPSRLAERGLQAASVSPATTPATASVCYPLRHRAVVRARRLRRGFGGRLIDLNPRRATDVTLRGLSRVKTELLLDRAFNSSLTIWACGHCERFSSECNSSFTRKVNFFSSFEINSLGPERLKEMFELRSTAKQLFCQLNAWHYGESWFDLVRRFFGISRIMSDAAGSEVGAKSEKPVWLRHVNYAVGPLKSTISVPVCGISTLIAIADHFFKIREFLVEEKILPENVSLYLPLIYLLIFLWTFWTIFQISVANGMLSEENVRLKAKELEHYEVHGCLHAVIHQTRDSFLADAAFVKLLDAKQKERIQHVHRTIESQLAMFEKAMRLLTRQDCCVVLKIVKEDRFVSICYGPNAPIDRKQKPAILPINQGIAQEAIVTKQVCFSNDTAIDQRFWPKEANEKYLKRYRTVVACPILINDTAYGVLCFDWAQPQLYSANYNELMACFVDIVSASFYVGHQSKKVRLKRKDIEKAIEEPKHENTTSAKLGGRPIPERSGN